MRIEMRRNFLAYQNDKSIMRDGDQSTADAQLKDVDFSERNLVGASFENSSFTNCNFRGLSLGAATIEDCTFEDCDFGNANFKAARLHEVSFNRSKLIGINWTQCKSLRGIEFERCNMNFCSFMSLRLKKLKFTDFSR